MSDSSNPFLALFGSSGSSSKLPPTPPQNPPGFSEVVEDIFRFTLRPSAPKHGQNQLFYLSELAIALQPQDWFDQPALEQGLFQYCVGLKKEEPMLIYLYQCYERICSKKYKDLTEPSNLSNIIYTNIQTALLQPELFSEQDLPEQFIELLATHEEDVLMKEFLNNFVKFYEKQEDDPQLSVLFSNVYDCIKRELNRQNILLVNGPLLDAYLVLCRNDSIAKSIVSSSILAENQLGKNVELTLLGSLFCCSCIPGHQVDFVNLFNHPSQSPLSVHSITEGNIWSALERLAQKVQKIIYCLLKSTPEVHNLTRKWLGQVLTLNKGRGQTWTYHSSSILRANFASDGFMLNFAAVLLKMCEPFSSDDRSSLEKLAKVNPTFCATCVNKVTEETEKQGIHIEKLHEETCLLAANEDEVRPANPPFTFLTELFYMTHKAIELGTKVSHNRLVEINQDLNKMQRMFQEVQGQHSEVAQQIQRRMDLLMENYLSYKAAMLVPEFIRSHSRFMIATSRWLCSVALDILPSQTTTLTFPLTKERNIKLTCIPEFLLSNVVDFVIFIRRFSPGAIEETGDGLMHFITLIVVFMGSRERINNPHLRAAMAEMLESLTPHENLSSSLHANALATFHREKLFREHPYKKEIVGSLLQVFVSIEMTGQGVAFEQKFNYRRPMYIVLKYLWNLKVQRKQLKVLAVDAESNMDAANPPLYLQFSNLLINDAIYLLDEALSHMSQLRELQLQRDNGNWPDVPPSQRGEKERTYQHLSMVARFLNLMGRETIHLLEIMTREIHGIFVHPTMVDRIASMLNYFLFHLVGPKKRNLKVKDFRAYEFEPSELVSRICEIYCHLSSIDAFCAAVSRDGRSYSPKLFNLAENVLSRIGRGELIGDLQQVANRVAELASEQAADEELSADAPEEFLDPIMSTVMMNPVILPSSKVTVDRSTIARHLLSDQTDPFNRSPLTMEDVKPNHELRERIQKWLEEKKN